VTTRWVVVLKLDVGPGVSYLDLDEIDRLVQAATRDGFDVIREPEGHTLKVVIDATTAAAALHTALTRWRDTAPQGLASWSVTRVEVSAAAEPGSPEAS